MSLFSIFKKRRKFTIDSSLIGANLVNYPLLFSIGEASGKNNVNLDSISQILGTDSLKVAFTLEDGETQLYSVLKKHDLSISKRWYLTNVSEVLSSKDSFGYMYYDSLVPDNTNYVNHPNTTTAEKVFDSNFKIVSLMEDNLSSSNLLDCTVNHNQGLLDNMGSSNNITGLVGGAIHFNGVDEDITYPYNSSLSFPGDVCVQILMRSTDNTGILIGQHTGTSYANWAIALSNSGQMQAIVKPDSGEISSDDINDGNWHMAGFTFNYSDGEIRHFIDGNNVKTTSHPSDIHTAQIAVKLFSDVYSTRIRGDLCLVFLSNIVRSVSWMEADYYNFFDQLITWEDEEVYKQFNFAVTNYETKLKDELPRGSYPRNDTDPDQKEMGIFGKHLDRV